MFRWLRRAGRGQTHEKNLAHAGQVPMPRAAASVAERVTALAGLLTYRESWVKELVRLTGPKVWSHGPVYVFLLL